MSRGNGNGQGPTNGHPGPPERLVVLGMPGYGELTAGASRGFWRATRLPDSRVWRQYNQGSLLASNFNGLWCSALNLAHAGRDVSHFAMQHADVEPEDWWLDTLIAEMEAHGLDVLGAVVPIKDPHGRTSIALDHPTGNTYRTLCRLTMNEVFRLPETFTSEDVGHPILLNTGLWVCRFDEAWARKVKFEINDRIVFDRNLDRYVPECEPEDWQFSRLCHELGLKIGATRKIKLNHVGPSPFSNGHPWGEPFDSAGVKESVLPKADRDGFAFPFDVEGWLTPAEGKELARIAAGKCVLEVGSYCGLSTICMARTAEEVVSVDPHDGRGTAVPRNTMPAFEANLERYAVTEKVEIIPGTFEQARNSYDLSNFDLIFIDAAHDLASVRSDIAHALPLLAPGGLLAFHDYRSPADPDVAVAVDALIDSGGELLSLTGSLAVVRPPASVPSPSLLEV
jgi:hypothetical protein